MVKSDVFGCQVDKGGFVILIFIVMLIKSRTI